MRRLGWLGGLVGCLVCLALAGCAGFFVDTTTSTTSTTSSTGDYVYAVNTAANTLSGYVVGANTLTLISGLPVTLETGLAVRSVAVTRPNTFVYVGGSGAIDCYAIGTGGALTAVAAGRVTALADFSSLTTSPDGQWLLALDGEYFTVSVYGINTSTGALTLTSKASLVVPSGVSLVSLTTSVLRISPASGAPLVLAATGTGGTDAFTFNTSTGALVYANTFFEAPAGAYSDNSVAFDATGTYAYVARATTGTGASGITSYLAASTGQLSEVANLVPTGNAPSSVVFDTSGTYLYAANSGDATLSGYTVASGVPTALASSPFATSGDLRALTRDNGGTYIVGVSASGAADVSLYALDALTAGKLNAAATATTGTAGLVAVAATH